MSGTPIMIARSANTVNSSLDNIMFNLLLDGKSLIHHSTITQLLYHPLLDGDSSLARSLCIMQSTCHGQRKKKRAAQWLARSLELEPEYF